MLARDDAMTRNTLRRSGAVRRFLSRAALAAALAAFAATAPAVHAQPKAAPSEETTQAEERFFAGQKLYQQDQFHDALTEFRASYELVKSPNSLLYVARCYRELNQIATAYDTYARVIAEAGDHKKYAKTKQAAEEEQAEIAGRVGRIVVDMPEDVRGARVRVGYRSVDSAMYDREMTIEAGKVVVHVEAPGHMPFDWEGQVAAGETRRVEVALSAEETEADRREKRKKARSPTKMHPLRPLAYVSGGVGVLGLITFGVFGSMASDRFQTLDARCDGRCPAGEQDEVDAGRRETTVANVGLAVGLVGLAGGITIFLLTPSQPLAAKPEGASSEPASLRLIPSASGSSLSLRGAF